jgi:predicted NBD/HSP70 family sugar kinase
MNEETFAWFVGIDWGSEKHQVCVLDQQGTVVGERSFPHSGAGLAELGDWLLTVAGAATAVAVGIEVPHGPVVDSLIDQGFMIYPDSAEIRQTPLPIAVEAILLHP